MLGIMNMLLVWHPIAPFLTLFLYNHSHAVSIYPSSNSKCVRTFSKLIDKKLFLYSSLNKTDGEHFISFIMSIIIFDV